MPFSFQPVQSQSKTSITQIMSILGAIAACVFAIAIPSVYYATSINGAKNTLTIEAAFLKKSIEKIIQARPDLWEYESVRLKEFISQPSALGEENEREIRTAAGKLVAKNDFTEPRPIISVSAKFFDAGQLAGSLVVRYSIRKQIITTALLGILSSLFGWLFYSIFRSYPIRKLENTLIDLQRERDKSDKTLYAIGDGVITVDHKGKIIFINRVAGSLVGMDASEALGRQLEEVYVLRRGQENQVGEMGSILSSKGGNEYFIEEVRTPLAEMKSDKSGVVIVFRNITERKQAEEALREKEHLLSETQKIAHIGSWTVTLDSMKNQWSDESYRIFGVTPESFVLTTESFLSLIHSDDRHTMEKWIQDCMTGKHPTELEFRIIRPDGTIRFLCGHGYLQLAPDRTPLRLVGSVQDITERKCAEDENRSIEERLQRSEKMEALGKLAGGVAHDLNNVLGVLSGYSELLMERIPEGNPLRQYAANILKSSEKCAAIIQDLLTLARRSVVVSEVVELNSIIANLLVAPEFNGLRDYHSQVTFKTDMGKDLLNINGSPVHLEKTVMNLVSNAAEAIIGSGEVKIQTENRYLDKTVRSYDTVNEGDYVVLTVSDTGRGITAADLDKIFEPFYTKKSMGRSGTGLGLAIVWGTVKDHNGYIDVQSIEGRGTTFTLYFPVTKERVREDAKQIVIEQYIGHGELVLVVDDIQDQRAVAVSILERLGYQANSVSSGEEAVEYLKNNKVDILVLDMIMEPGIDGLETYRQIIDINPHQKAIIVSGFSETDRVKEAQKLGAGAYVKKPYVMEKIGLAIQDELLKVTTSNAQG